MRASYTTATNLSLLDDMLGFASGLRPVPTINPEDECGPSGDSGTSPPQPGAPWLSVVEAARHAGWPCANGRAPASFYDLAQRVGVKFNGKWRIHRDDLDAEMRRHAVLTR